MNTRILRSQLFLGRGGGDIARKICNHTIPLHSSVCFEQISFLEFQPSLLALEEEDSVEHPVEKRTQIRQCQVSFFEGI